MQFRRSGRKFRKTAKAGRRKPAVEGVYAPQEVASAEKLTDAVGFPVRDIASLKEKATDRSYVTYGDGLAEITYRWDSQSICFRQSQGQEDNSGDYTHYAEEKLIVVGKYSVTFKGQEKGSYMIATWSDGTYSFSVSATQAFKKAEFLGLIEEIEKIFEKFKKLLTLLPGYTIIYLASRMRHKQHGRNNIAFGVWLSLARAPGLGPGGRRFESCHPDLQFNILCGCSSMVEH